MMIDAMIKMMVMNSSSKIISLILQHVTKRQLCCQGYIERSLCVCGFYRLYKELVPLRGQSVHAGV